MGSDLFGPPKIDEMLDFSVSAAPEKNNQITDITIPVFNFCGKNEKNYSSLFKLSN